MDVIRVLRVVEYVGPRDAVEKQVANSIHGTRSGYGLSGMTISAATVGAYPEVVGTVPRAMVAQDIGL